MTNFFRKYIEYLKDNPEGYWFKAKVFGWLKPVGLAQIGGWTPATREGWLVTLLALLLIIGNAVRFERGGYPDSEVFMQVIVPTAVIVLVLLIICFRTGEPPRWQWSIPEKKNEIDSEQDS